MIESWEHVKIELAFQLAESGYPQEVLTMAQGFGDESWQASILAALGLAPDLPESLLRQALTTVQKMQYADNRGWALVGLARHLAEPLEGEALQESLTGVYGYEVSCWGEALHGLPAYLPEPFRGEVLRVALAAARELPEQDQTGRGFRAEALVGLVPYLPEPLNRQVAQEALVAAQHIQRRQPLDRIWAVAKLAPYLSESLLREALVMIWAIEDGWRQAVTLAKLAPHLPGTSLPEALAVVQKIGWDECRADALVGLAHRLPEPLLQEALTMAWEIRDEDSRVRALAALIPRLPEVLSREVLREALATVRYNIWWWDEGVEALTMLISQLSPPLLLEALALLARELPGSDWMGRSPRAEVLARLALHLSEPLRREVLWKALAAARAIRGEDNRAKALAKLGPHLLEPERGQVLREALAAAWGIRSKYDWAEVLARLAPHLPELLLQETLVAVREILDGRTRALVLVRLAPRLAELDYPEESLTAVRGIGDADDRAKALAGLAPHLAQLPGQRLYPLWQETLPILASRTRKDLLADLRALEPVIAALGGVEAVAETFRAIQDVGRWWP